MEHDAWSGECLVSAADPCEDVADVLDLFVGGVVENIVGDPAPTRSPNNALGRVLADVCAVLIGGHVGHAGLVGHAVVEGLVQTDQMVSAVGAARRCAVEEVLLGQVVVERRVAERHVERTLDGRHRGDDD